MAMLLVAWSRTVAAQEGVVVHGRVTDLDGVAIAGALVRLSSPDAGMGRSVLSDSLGQYEVNSGSPAPPLELRAERIGYHSLTVELRPGAGEARILRDLRLRPRSVELPAVTATTAPLPGQAPSARTPGGSDEATATFLTDILPIAPGDLMGLAALRSGVILVGGDDGVPGVSIAGQHPSQNSVTLDGAPFGSTTLPAEALRNVAVATSTYDPSRGRYSGGEIAATTRSGTNSFGGATSVRGSGPPLQLSGGLVADDQQAAVLQAEGGMGGALARDRFFYYGAWQATRRRRARATLGNASPALLRALGASADSARRFASILDGLGYAPPRSAAAESFDAASALLRLDYRFSDRHAALARISGDESRIGGVGESPLALAGSGGELRRSGAMVLAQLTSTASWGRNDLLVSRSVARRSARPTLAGPTILARGASASTDDAAILRYGGVVDASESKATTLEVADEVIVEGGSLGRFRMGGVLNREEISLEDARDAFGTFSFASLAELARGEPISFTRALGARRRDGAAGYAALYAGHIWHPAPTLSVIYGARLERFTYPGSGEGGPPSETGFSPRAGFTWQGARRGWEVRGGIGEFRGRFPLSALAEARGGSESLRLVCIGPAVPPLRVHPSAVPSACADSQSAFASRSPSSTVFARDVAVPRTWQGSGAWSWDAVAGRLGRMGLHAEAALTLGVAVPVAHDENVVGEPRFPLAEEGGRPVYVAPSAIDPSTGGVAPDASRRVAGAGIVRRVESGGRSRSARFSVGAVFLSRWQDVLMLDYTLMRATDEVGALPAPGGFALPVAASSPTRRARATSDLERRHSLQLVWSRPLLGLPVELGAIARVTSGESFTPFVDADVNGDGAGNDPAYVFDPARTADPSVAAGMARLLGRAPRATRRCLERQLGRVAARNSCRTPASTSLDLQADIIAGKPAARRLVFTVLASNMAAGADRLLHGVDGQRGWGQAPAADPILLRVRGFDPARGAFRYEVNPAFGAARPRDDLDAEPFTLTLRGRWTFGRDPARQPLTNMIAALRAQRRPAAEVRRSLAATIPNLAAQVLSLDESLGLKLGADQRARLRVVADSSGERLGDLTDRLADAWSGEPARGEASDSLAREMQSALNGTVDLIRAALTPEQWARLPRAIRQPSLQLMRDAAGRVNQQPAW